MEYSLTTYTLLLTIIVIILWKITRSYIRMLSNKFPGPFPLPIIGHAYKFKVNSVEFLDQMLEYAETFGSESGLIGGYAGSHLAIILTKARTVETLLVSSQLIKKSHFYNFLMPWLGTGLLTSTGEKWHNRRKMLTPSFHFRILAEFIQVFNEQANKMVLILKKKTGHPFDISRNITNCALDIICETAMGKKLNAQEDSESGYVKAIYRISEIIFNRMRFPWLWPDFIYNNIASGKEHNKMLHILHDFTKQVITERRSHKKMDKLTDKCEFTKQRLAFLDMLLEAEGADLLSLEDIREEVDTFMFEGHDTTAAGIQWAIHLISHHPIIQNKLQEEIDLLFKDKECLTMEDLSQLKYLDCVIKETLRLFPPVPMFAREVNQDTQFGSYKVPKGSTALVLVQAVHRDAEYFPEPNKFNPDRWSSAGEEKKIHPMSFIPFSAGMRNCIGQKFALLEMKVVLAYMLHHFFISTSLKMSDVRACGELILRPEKGIIVTLEQRNNT